MTLYEKLTGTSHGELFQHHEHTMKKHLLLLGAGHAHAVLLKTWLAEGFRPQNCCLVSESPLQIYSGMVPGWLAGDYALEDCQLNVAALCQRLGVEWLEASVSAIDAQERWVEAAGVRYEFDFLSINLGCQQASKPLSANAVAIKPFPAFVAQVAQWDAQFAAAPSNAAALAVVGGGLGGYELVLGLAARYKDARVQPSLHWFTGPKGPLPKLAAGARRQALQLLSDQPVQVHQQYYAADHLGTECLGQVWACQGRAGDVVSTSRLSLDEGGFIFVDEYFQSLSHPGIFAAGDVCRRLDRKLVPSGVNAVRAGAVLAANLKYLCTGRGSQWAYQPARWVLQIAALGGGQALGLYGPFYWQAAWVWRLKRLIDQRFMRSFASAASD
ncbi:MAG: FAD-dependent oxidoreductase [Marinagarivorans sp.]